MPTSDQWKSAVAIAVRRHPESRKSIVNSIRRRYPKSSQKTLEEIVSRFAIFNNKSHRYQLRTSPRPRLAVEEGTTESRARKFFKEFVRIGSAPRERDWFQRQLSGRSYTRHFLSLIASVGRTMGYQVLQGREVARRDQVWRGADGEYHVVIEHENIDWKPEGLASEFEHLELSDADLRILVIYPPAKRLESASEAVVREILNRFKRRSRGDFEFLLLVAHDNLDDVRDFRAYLVSRMWTSTRI